MYRKLFSHSVLYAVGPQLPSLANLLILPIITRYLTAEDYGIYGTILAYVAGLKVIHKLGLINVCNISFFKDSRFKWVWRQLFGFLSVWGILYSILLSTVLYWALSDQLGDKIYPVLFLVLLPVLFFEVVNELGYRFLQLSEKPFPITVISIVAGFIAIGITLYTIAYLKMGFLGWLVSNLSLSFISFLYYFYVIIIKNKITPLIHLRFRHLKRHFKLGLPFVPSSYGAFLLISSDRVLMDLLNVNLKNIGFYNIAYSIGNTFQTLATGVGLAVRPLYFGLLKENTESSRNQVRDMTFVLQVAFILGTFLLSLWMKELFYYMVSNEELQLAYPLAIIIVMSANNSAFRFAFNNIVVFAEETNILWKVYLVAGIINVVLNIIFIPMYGVSAAVVTTFIAWMYLGFAGFFYPTYKKIKSPNYYPILWLIIVVFFTGLVYSLKDISIYYKSILTLIELVLMGALLYFNKDKINN